MARSPRQLFARFLSRMFHAIESIDDAAITKDEIVRRVGPMDPPPPPPESSPLACPCTCGMCAPMSESEYFAGLAEIDAAEFDFTAPIMHGIDAGLDLDLGSMDLPCGSPVYIDGEFHGSDAEHFDGGEPRPDDAPLAGYTIGNRDAYERAIDENGGSIQKEIGGAWFPTLADALYALVYDDDGETYLPRAWFPGRDPIPASVYACTGGTVEDCDYGLGAKRLTSPATVTRIPSD